MLKYFKMKKVKISMLNIWGKSMLKYFKISTLKKKDTYFEKLGEKYVEIF